MFETIQPSPPDPILGLTEAFLKDPNPDKVNLGVGVYKDESGQTGVFRCVKEAERMLVENETTKGYLGIGGTPEYAEAVQRLLFQDKFDGLKDRLATIQSLGGTGALRVAGEFIKEELSGPKIWFSNPTWVNHGKVFAASGLETADYPYYSNATRTLEFDKTLEALKAIPKGDIVLLHGCCHNPTGADLELDQWRQVFEITKKNQLLPFIDLAYQGFANGISADVEPLQLLADYHSEFIVASSFSKNIGLYRERIGALTIASQDANSASNCLGALKRVIRANYSNPPSHGQAIVTASLTDDRLRGIWVEEVDEIRNRIRQMRDTFSSLMADRGHDFSHIKRQQGMVSLLGISKEQVDELKKTRSIYLVGSSRINMAGLTSNNIERVVDAICTVL